MAMYVPLRQFHTPMRPTSPTQNKRPSDTTIPPTQSHPSILRTRTPLDHTAFQQPLGTSTGYLHLNGDQRHSAASLPSVSSASSFRHDNDNGFTDMWPSTPSSVAGDPLVVKTPTFEYYGFVVYMVSLAVFGVYIIWAYLPSEMLKALGFTYYPDRYWALVLPAWLFMAVLSIYFLNMAYIMYATPPLDSPDAFYDPNSNIAPGELPEEHMCHEVGGIPNVADIPISVVNKCLYK